LFSRCLCVLGGRESAESEEDRENGEGGGERVGNGVGDTGVGEALEGRIKSMVSCVIKKGRLYFLSVLPVYTELKNGSKYIQFKSGAVSPR